MPAMFEAAIDWTVDESETESLIEGGVIFRRNCKIVRPFTRSISFARDFSLFEPGSFSALSVLAIAGVIPVSPVPERMQTKNKN